MFQVTILLLDSLFVVYLPLEVSTMSGKVSTVIHALISLKHMKSIYIECVLVKYLCILNLRVYSLAAHCLVKYYSCSAN